MTSKKSICVELGEPSVICQAPIGETRWGYYQFPDVYCTKDRKIYVHWVIRPDTTEAHEGVTEGEAVSEDGGQTWRPRTKDDHPVPDVLMPNGKHFMGFVGKFLTSADYMEHYQPIAVGRKGRSVYFAQDIKEWSESFFGREYDPKTDEITQFPITLNWRFMPLVEHEKNRVLPMSYSLAVSNAMGTVELDDGLYYASYSYGFNSFAETRDQAITPYSKYLSVYVFRSTDNARTWDCISQVSVTGETVFEEDTFEGFGEPMMEKMSDGSVVMLIRSGGNFAKSYPSYLVRSTDNCRSWSKPQKFGEVGVRPQIMRLNCGVTLATYGRPGLFLRATDDASGLVWNDPIEIPLGEGEPQKSCYYNSMLPLSDDSALLVYTDFHYPVPNTTQTAKTVLARKITVSRV